MKRVPDEHDLAVLDRMKGLYAFLCKFWRNVGQRYASNALGILAALTLGVIIARVLVYVIRVYSPQFGVLVFSEGELLWCFETRGGQI